MQAIIDAIIADPTLIEVFNNSVLDVIWPLLPAETLEQLAYN